MTFLTPTMMRRYHRTPSMKRIYHSRNSETAPNVSTILRGSVCLDSTERLHLWSMCFGRFRWTLFSTWYSVSFTMIFKEFFAFTFKIYRRELQFICFVFDFSALPGSNWSVSVKFPRFYRPTSVLWNGASHPNRLRGYCYFKLFGTQDGIYSSYRIVSFCTVF